MSEKFKASVFISKHLTDEQRRTPGFGKALKIFSDLCAFGLGGQQLSDDVLEFLSDFDYAKPEQIQEWFSKSNRLEVHIGPDWYKKTPLVFMEVNLWSGPEPLAARIELMIQAESGNRFGP